MPVRPDRCFRQLATVDLGQVVADRVERSVKRQCVERCRILGDGSEQRHHIELGRLGPAEQLDRRRMALVSDWSSRVDEASQCVADGARRGDQQTITIVSCGRGSIELAVGAPEERELRGANLQRRHRAAKELDQAPPSRIVRDKGRRVAFDVGENPVQRMNSHAEAIQEGVDPARPLLAVGIARQRSIERFGDEGALAVIDIADRSRSTGGILRASQLPVGACDEWYVS